MIDFDSIMLFEKDYVTWFNLGNFVPDAYDSEFLWLLIAYDESSMLLIDRLDDYAFGYWR